MAGCATPVRPCWRWGRVSESTHLRCQRCGILHQAHPDASSTAPPSFVSDQDGPLCAVCKHKLDYEAQHVGNTTLSTYEHKEPPQTTLTDYE